MAPRIYCTSCSSEIRSDSDICPSCGLLRADMATQRLDSQKSPSRKSVSLESIDDARFIPGTILADRYRIVGLLGKGGMGEVYRADDLKLSQPVALKFLPDRLLSDGAALARFHREVRVARQVTHKNVCRVYDLGELDHHHFLSMEFIKGEELSSLLRRIGRLPADKAIQIARQICAGLAAAHDSGVLHRDLKPANIMIDGDGNARITDFGLAGLSEEFREDEMSAGTPAYMSPEQLERQPVTVRSDIYSLGLVLYELFTGKRAFDAPSLGELMRLRRSDSRPTTPSEFVKDLDPVIERLIDRCIQKDPARRPASALQVAAALPGGDPIAAALAAGETPSPEMVAAAPKQGTLRPPVAIALLSATVFFLVAAMFLSGQVALHRIVPFEKSTELLQEQAKQITKSFGYTSSPGDAVSGFYLDADYYQYLRHNSLDPWEALRSPQPPLVQFWHRQSPGVLYPSSGQIVTFSDPARDIPGMLQLLLDTEGKLFYFEAVPEQVQSPKSGSGPTVREGSQVPSSQAEVWPALFQAAGLDINRFQAIQSEWTPPHAYDARQAWTGAYPNLPQVPIRVEAAAFHNRPVYFEIVSPWTKPAANQADLRRAGEKAGVWILFGVFFGILLLGALLALKNLRLGRGDRRGAFRVTLFVFLARMIVWVFATHHLADRSELLLLITGLQSSLFWSCFIGVNYLALEPYLRRRWPERIISWNRLLAGDFRDPLVGRDLLIGAAFGSFWVAMMYFRLALPRWLGGSQVIPDLMFDAVKFGFGVSSFWIMFINQITASIAQAFMIVFLLLFLSLLLRKDWLGIGVGSLILIALLVSPDLGQSHWMGIAGIALSVVALVFCAVRFGPLALMAMIAVFHLWVFYPITTKLTAWYATTFVLALILMLSMAIYGFYVSLGGQKVFGGKLLQED